MSEAGGHVVPDGWMTLMEEQVLTGNPYRRMFPPPKPVRLTPRLRLRIWLMDLRYALARRIYPAAFYDEED